MNPSITLRRMRVAGLNAMGRHHRSAAHAVRRTLWPLLPWLLAAGLVAPAAARALATRIELLLQGMDCALCVQGLEQRLKSLPGAQQVQLDLERGRLSLLLRPGSTVDDQTLRELMRNAGFVVRQIRRSPVSP